MRRCGCPDVPSPTVPLLRLRTDKCSDEGACAVAPYREGGFCFCYQGTRGPSCRLRPEYICINGCSGHGRCLRGLCACDMGWFGIDCGVDLSRPDSRLDTGIIFADSFAHREALLEEKERLQALRGEGQGEQQPEQGDAGDGGGGSGGGEAAGNEAGDGGGGGGVGPTRRALRGLSSPRAELSWSSWSSLTPPMRAAAAAPRRRTASERTGSVVSPEDGTVTYFEGIPLQPEGTLAGAAASAGAAPQKQRRRQQWDAGRDPSRRSARLRRRSLLAPSSGGGGGGSKSRSANASSSLYLASSEYTDAAEDAATGGVVRDGSRLGSPPGRPPQKKGTRRGVTKEGARLVRRGWPENKAPLRIYVYEMQPFMNMACEVRDAFH